MGAGYSVSDDQALWMEPLARYDTDSVAKALLRLEAHFGTLETIHSDQGTQLVAAGKLQLVDDEGEGPSGGGDITRLFPDTEWLHGAPKAPWEQGGVERFVGMAKKQMKLMMREQHKTMMNYEEFHTLLYRISSIINDRPLLLSPGIGEALTPNQLIHYEGRGPRMGDGLYSINLTPSKKRLDLLLKSWWDRYMLVFSRNCYKEAKWRKEQDNLEVGDVVMLLDKPGKFGSYKVGRISEAEMDRRGLVRKVKVKYSTGPKSKELKEVERHVGTLALLERAR